jgi:hypothetical protein
MKENLEQSAGQALLNEGVKFGIKVWGKERLFIIKPLKLGTIIAISKESSALCTVNGDIELVPALVQSSDNLKALAKVVALACLNTRFKNKFSGLLANWLMYKLTTKELYQLSIIVVKQIDVEDFFFTIRLIGGVNLLKSKTEPKEEKQSGEPLQE